MKKNIIFILSLICGVFIVDIETIIILMLTYVLGSVLVFKLNSTNKVSTVKVFQILFIAGTIYMLASYLYMIAHNYSYLLAPDINADFIPAMEQLLDLNNYPAMITEIWKDYTVFSRKYFGFYTYSIHFALLSKALGANLYVIMQISVLLLYSFSGIVVYKLLQNNGFNSMKSYKYAIIISLISIIFFYSSLFLRDIHIMFLYLLGIYFTFKKEFSMINLIKIIVVILITCTIRIETGLFLFVLIPAYLLLTLKQSRQKSLVIFFSMIIAVIGIALLLSNYAEIKLLFEANQENYVEHISSGEGVIGTLQKIPIAGDFLSIIYNALLPIPLWSQFAPPPNQPHGGETYNIMNFPHSISSLFNLFILFLIAFWLFSKDIKIRVEKHLTKPMIYQLLIGLFYLWIQSAVTAKRRLMAYYVVYYIFAFIIFENMTSSQKRNLFMITFLFFGFLQIFGVFYLM